MNIQKNLTIFLLLISLCSFTNNFTFNKQRSFNKKIKLIKENKLPISASEQLQQRICNIVDGIEKDGLDKLEENKEIVACSKEIAAKVYTQMMKDNLSLTFHPKYKKSISHNKIVKNVLNIYADYSFENKIKAVILGAIYLDFFIAHQESKL